FLVLIWVGGVPGWFALEAQIYSALCLALGILLIATLVMRRAFWRPGALILTGLAVLVLEGLLSVALPGMWAIDPLPIFASGVGLIVLGVMRACRVQRGRQESAASGSLTTRMEPAAPKDSAP